MLRDEHGMTAYIDAMAFMVILMLALSALSATYGFEEETGPNASEALDVISSSKVRLSDLTDMDDDAVVYLTDVLA